MGSTNPRRSCPNSSVGSMGAPSLVSCGRGVYVAHQRVIVTRGEAWKLWQEQASGTVGLRSHWGKGCVGGVWAPAEVLPPPLSRRHAQGRGELCALTPEAPPGAKADRPSHVPGGADHGARGH